MSKRKRTPKPATMYLVPDAERIDAARWAARELLLPAFIRASVLHGTEFRHQLAPWGAVVSTTPHTTA